MSPMAPWLKMVVHKTYVRVDERGAEEALERSKSDRHGSRDRGPAHRARRINGNRICVVLRWASGRTVLVK